MSQDDLSLTPDIDFNVLCNNDTQEHMSVTPEIDSQEEYVPQPTNTLADYPTSPELRGEPKSPYSDLTSSSDDEIISPSLLPRHRICTHFSQVRDFTRVILPSKQPDEGSSEDYSAFRLSLQIIIFKVDIKLSCKYVF